MPQISKALIQRICDKNYYVSNLVIEGINPHYRAELFHELREIYKSITENGVVSVESKPLYLKFYEAIHIVSQQMEVLEIKNLEEYFVAMIKKIIQGNKQRTLSHLIIYQKGTNNKTDYRFDMPAPTHNIKKRHDPSEVTAQTTTKKVKLALANNSKVKSSSVVDVTNIDFTPRSVSSSPDASPPRLESSSPVSSDTDEQDDIVSINNKIALAEKELQACRDELAAAKKGVRQRLAELQVSHKIISPVTLFNTGKKVASMPISDGNESFEAIKLANKNVARKHTVGKSPLSHESKASTALNVVDQSRCIPVLLSSKSRSSDEIKKFKKTLFKSYDYIPDCEANVTDAEKFLASLQDELRVLISPSYLSSDSLLSSFMCDEVLSPNTRITSIFRSALSSVEKNESVLMNDVTDVDTVSLTTFNSYNPKRF